MKLPTEAEINVHDSLDERCACDHFLGKTLKDAEALFADNALVYLEDLMFMGPSAFRFYVEAAIHYIKATKDHEMVSAFAGVLEHRLEFERSELAPVAPQLAEICRFILMNSEECGIPQTQEEIEARAQSFGSLVEALDTQDELGKSFDVEQFVDLRHRYEVLRDAFAKMAEEDRQN